MWAGLFSNDEFNDEDYTRSAAREEDDRLPSWELDVTETSTYSPLRGPTHEADYYSPKSTGPVLSQRNRYMPETPEVRAEEDEDEDEDEQSEIGVEQQPDTERSQSSSARQPVYTKSPSVTSDRRIHISPKMSLSEGVPIADGVVSTTTTADTDQSQGNEGEEEDSTSTVPMDADKHDPSFFHSAPPPPGVDAPTQFRGAYNTAPPSSNTVKRAAAAVDPPTGEGGRTGVAKHACLSFSEVEVDEEEHDIDDILDSNSAGSFGSAAGGTMRGSGRISREVLHRRLKKRIKAWRRFLAVMQDHGLRVRKHHRRGKGWAHRVVKYDPALPGLTWKSSKWWDSSGGQLPLRDVLDVERSGKTVWVKCLHLGTVGFEATLENDSVIFYLAMDSLLNKRCGVQEGDVCIPGPLASA